MLIRQVGAEFFLAGGQTDMTKLSLFVILRTRLETKKHVRRGEKTGIRMKQDTRTPALMFFTRAKLWPY
jgi:hypothetical protein